MGNFSNNRNGITTLHVASLMGNFNWGPISRNDIVSGLITDEIWYHPFISIHYHRVLRLSG